MNIFKWCLILGDSYEDVLENYASKEKALLVIYVGADNDGIEAVISKFQMDNNQLSLSTFQEEHSFFHASLASKIDIHKKSFSSELYNRVIKELEIISYPEENIKIIGEDLH